MDQDKIYIGFAGKAGCGKDTIAQIIKETLIDSDAPYCVYTRAFAGPLKKTLCEMYGVPPHFFDDREGKEKKMKELGDRSPREVMQWFGTEVVRAMDTDHWVKRFANDPVPFDYTKSFDYPHIILATDVRFPNERKFIKDNAGIMVYIHRDEKELDVGEDINTSHASEIEAYDESIEYDYYLDNSATLTHLKLTTKAFMNVIGLT